MLTWIKTVDPHPRFVASDRWHRLCREPGVAMPNNAISRSPAVIIVVDDDRAVRNSLKFSLEIEGFAVKAYGAPAELLAEVNFPECGCLVIDYKLPEMNGLQLLGKLRERNVTLPACLITTHPGPAIRQEASRAGVMVIEKPLLDESLIDEVRHAMACDHQARHK